MRLLSAILSASLLFAAASAAASPRRATHVRRHAAPVLADAAKPKKVAKQATCDVVEFHATKTGAKSVDPGLSKWKGQLDQPPLSAFDTFKVTGSKTLTIPPGSTGSVKITANLGVLFKGTVTENDKDRLQLEITIDNAAGKRMYRSNTTQDPGALLMLTAGKSGDANVFFAVTCSAQ